MLSQYMKTRIDREEHEKRWEPPCPHPRGKVRYVPKQQTRLVMLETRGLGHDGVEVVEGFGDE